MKKALYIAIALACFAVKSQAQMVAVNTDVAMDACQAYSAGVEIAMTKKSSLNINALHGWNIVNQDIRLTAFQPEWRVYVSGRPMFRHYFGFMGLYANYKSGEISGKIYDGDAGGFGFSYGYVLPVTQRLLVDFHTSLGYVYYHQKEYFASRNYDYDSDPMNYNEDGFPMANAHGSLFIPMRIGVSVTYILR